jgi:RNA polymerase sigma-70 factor (ECF subfamily)
MRILVVADERGSGDLVRASRAGDRAALESLLERHLPGLRAFVRLRMSPLLRGRESASDMVQSACMDLLLGLDRFEYRSEAAFRNWLYVAVLNKLRAHERDLRADKRDARREVSLTGSSSGERPPVEVYAHALSPSLRVMAEERLQELEEAFDELPEHYREVITLSRIARVPRAQIAVQMGRSEDSVRNLLTRALVALAQTLDRRQRRDG